MEEFSDVGRVPTGSQGPTTFPRGAAVAHAASPPAATTPPVPAAGPRGSDPHQVANGRQKGERRQRSRHPGVVVVP
jgi:hypothetical protein